MTLPKPGGQSAGLVGSHGWISETWQKNPLLLGFSDTATESVSRDTIAANETIDSTVVPAGEIWVIATMALRNNSSGLTSAGLYFNIDGNYLIVKQELAALAQFEWFIWVGMVVLAEGDSVAWSYTGTTIGDAMQLNFIGYKIDIDQ
ncbi:hypothetical protein LCGC14_1810480 [marine sediment metagenome]|uniref:Uncharacterized protein n=1 Tax=marine sediment metagenome TaxID=412755 RepID=A0A0F9H9Z9_9ZZZZ